MCYTERRELGAARALNRVGAKSADRRQLFAQEIESWVKGSATSSSLDDSGTIGETLLPMMLHPTSAFGQQEDGIVTVD